MPCILFLEVGKSQNQYLCPHPRKKDKFYKEFSQNIVMRKELNEKMLSYLQQLDLLPLLQHEFSHQHLRQAMTKSFAIPLLEHQVL